MIKIIVDAFGGDRSPVVNVEGTIRAINENKDLHVILTGDEEVLRKELSKHQYNIEQITILHAPDVISCDEVPTEAIRKKKESSMVVALNLLRTDDEVKGLVTIGSTGALLAGAVLRVGRIRGVKRPGFCPILPTMTGGVVAVCDSGANVDCDALHLQQFALMGNLYMKKAFGIENPRVALLNIGTESEKGDALRKETYKALQQMDLNFVGNMESRDLLSGDYDLVVADGFSGNVLIKSTEGTALELLKLLKKAMTKNLKSKIGALILKKEVMAIKDMMDYNNYGGAVLLGANKTIVKGHGSSKSTAVYHCIKQAYRLEKEGLRDAIAAELEKIEDNNQ